MKSQPIRGTTLGMGSGSGGSAISIHAPHTGRDLPLGLHRLTPRDFNPRAPYGARRNTSLTKAGSLSISIHAPHTGRDQSTDAQRPRAAHFNPRAPYGARRRRATFELDGVRISIHAPHTGRDYTAQRWERGTINFNPRAPYGARLKRLPQPYANTPFQSTRPIRGATPEWTCCPQCSEFQSTRPIRGATTWPARRTYQAGHFNPRAPYGARRFLPTIQPFCW